MIFISAIQNISIEDCLSYFSYCERVCLDVTIENSRVSKYFEMFTNFPLFVIVSLLYDGEFLSSIDDELEMDFF